MTYVKTYLPTLKTHVATLKRDANDLSRDLQRLEVRGELGSKTLYYHELLVQMCLNKDPRASSFLEVNVAFGYMFPQKSFSECSHITNIRVTRYQCLMHFSILLNRLLFSINGRAGH